MNNNRFMILAIAVIAIAVISQFATNVEGENCGGIKITHVDPTPGQFADGKTIAVDTTNGLRVIPDDVTLEVDSTNGLQVKDISAFFTPSVYAGQESVTLPNGLIMKMGSTTFSSGWGLKTVTFGTAFPNGIVTAICNGSAGLCDRNNHSDTSSLTKSSFQTYGAGGNVQWFAIGW